MPNFVYNKAKESFLGGTNTVDLLGASIGVALVSSGYTANSSSTAAVLNDVVASTSVGTVIVKTAYLSTSDRSITNGVFDAADITVSSVPGTTPIDKIIIFQAATSNQTDTSVLQTASRLIAYLDQAGGLPVTPGGANITVSWDNGDNKIFRL